MNLQEAILIVGSHISEVSKMPGFSFGLSAKDCLVGSKLRQVEGSTCHRCYAFRGQYTFSHVWQAHKRRLEGLTHPQWVEAMVYLINDRLDSKRHHNHVEDRDTNYFRWHDSGDLQSIQHLENIAEIARRTEPILHWIPTREYGIVKDWIESGGVRPANLIIRLSAHLINGPLPIKLAKELKIQTSGVHTKDWKLTRGIRECPAHLQGNKCMDCRNCWNPKIMSISYLKH